MKTTTWLATISLAVPLAAGSAFAQGAPLPGDSESGMGGLEAEGEAESEGQLNPMEGEAEGDASAGGSAASSSGSPSLPSPDSSGDDSGIATGVEGGTEDLPGEELPEEEFAE